MEQDLNRLKRNVRISAIAAIIACGAITASSKIKEIRAVDFLQIFAAGVAFGALLVNLIIIRRLRNKS
jgi:hypothetical protein